MGVRHRGALCVCALVWPAPCPRARAPSCVQRPDPCPRPMRACMQAGARLERQRHRGLLEVCDQPIPLGHPCVLVPVDLDARRALRAREHACQAADLRVRPSRWRSRRPCPNARAETPHPPTHSPTHPPTHTRPHRHRLPHLLVQLDDAALSKRLCHLCHRHVGGQARDVDRGVALEVKPSLRWVCGAW